MTTKKLAKQLGLIRKRTASSSSLTHTSASNQRFSYLIIIDFESTCWKEKNNYGQEIIEFPAVLMNTHTGLIESEFHSYVQPQEHPHLSSFCTELTGITQEQVEAGLPLQICLSRFTRWIHTLHKERNVVFLRDNTHTHTSTSAKPCAFLTWSDWDLGVCLQYECKRKQITKPDVLNSWIDLRATYRIFYQRKPKGLNGALQDLGIEFSGREHSGLDDARNTAGLAWRMIRDGCVMKITKCVSGVQMKVCVGGVCSEGRVCEERKQKQLKHTETECDPVTSSHTVLSSVTTTTLTHPRTTLTHPKRPHTTLTHSRTTLTHLHSTIPHLSRPHTTLTHLRTTLTHPSCQDSTLTHLSRSQTTLTHPKRPHTTLTHPSRPHTTLTHPSRPDSTLTHLRTTLTHQSCQNSTLTHLSRPDSTVTHPSRPHTTLTHLHTTLTHPSRPNSTLTHPRTTLTRPDSTLTHTLASECLEEFVVGEFGDSGSYDDVILDDVSVNRLHDSPKSRAKPRPLQSNPLIQYPIRSLTPPINSFSIYTDQSHQSFSSAVFRVPSSIPSSAINQSARASVSVDQSDCSFLPANQSKLSVSLNQSALSYISVNKSVNQPHPSFSVNQSSLSSSKHLPLPSTGGGTKSAFTNKSALSSSRFLNQSKLSFRANNQSCHATLSTNQSASSCKQLPRPLPRSGVRITSPLCDCGRRSRRLTVCNGGPNHGRVFYTCAGRRSSAHLPHNSTRLGPAPVIMGVVSLSGSRL